MSCAGTESMTYADDELDQIQTDYKMLPGKCDRLFRDYHALRDNDLMSNELASTHITDSVVV